MKKYTYHPRAMHLHAAALGMHYIRLTGHGDSHFADRGWFSGNNFATWIAAEADEIPACRIYGGTE